MKVVQCAFCALTIVLCSLTKAYAGVYVPSVTTTVTCAAVNDIRHGSLKLIFRSFEDGTTHITGQDIFTGQDVLYRNATGALDRSGTGTVRYLSPRGTHAQYTFYHNRFGQLVAQFYENGLRQSLLPCNLAH